MLYSNSPDYRRFIRNIVRNDVRHDCYHEACEHAEEMSVHLYGKRPVKLLQKVRPREDAETTRYRLSSYEATTKSTAGKALSILAKIFNPTIFSIVWDDPGSDAKMLQNYTMVEYPEFNSIIKFLAECATKKMLADPNGIMAVRPRKMDLAEDKRVEPEIKLYGSPNIWWMDSESYLIFIKKMPPRTPGESEIWIFESFDTVNIVSFSVEFPNPETTVIFDEQIYPHGCSQTPAWQLKGIPEIMDNGVCIQKSFFDDALAFWNLAITHESDLFGAYINHLHPLRAELAEECDYMNEGQRCKGGKFPLLNKDGSVSGSGTCPSCNGSGYRSVKSPYGVYQYNKEKLQEGTTSLTPVQYITIPTDATKMLEARVDKMHDKGLNALNMDIVNRVGENQSGIAKERDRQELNDFLFKISDVIFTVHLNNIFYYFNQLMFNVSFGSKPADPLNPSTLDSNLPNINKPINFDISTASELINEMETNKKAGLSTSYIKQAQKDIIAKKFAGSQDVLLEMNLKIDLDPMPDLAVADAISLQSGAQKTFTEEDFIIHFNISKFVERALDEDDQFINKDCDVQYSVLVGYAEELISNTKTKLTVDGTEINSQVDDGKVTDPVIE